MRTSARRDWLVVLACLGCQVGMGTGGYIFPVFLEPVVDELGWSSTKPRAVHLLDKARQPRAVAASAGLGEEGLEVLAHHALQHAVLGVAAHARVPAAAGRRPPG